MTFLNSFKFFLKESSYRFYHLPRIGSLRKGSNTKGVVCICYLTSPFLNGFLKARSNEENIKSIVGAFIDLGYEVDVYDYNSSPKYHIKKKYDIIFGFGSFFKYIVDYQNKRSFDFKSISYFTELPGEYTVEIERSRISYLRGKGYKVSLAKNSRGGHFFTKSHHIQSNYLIFTGPDRNLCYFDKYNFRKKIAIQPSILELSDLNLRVHRKENSFVWVGSFGGIVKGVDILIDIFNRKPDWSLSMFGLDSRDKKAFLKKLPKNIKNMGFHSPNSKTFVDTLSSTKYVLSPSFSEGSATGVLTAMAYGCLPVVSSETGTEFPAGMPSIYFKCDQNTEKILVDIENILLEFNALPQEYHAYLSIDSRKKYCQDSFYKNFSKSITEVIKYEA